MVSIPIPRYTSQIVLVPVAQQEYATLTCRVPEGRIPKLASIRQILSKLNYGSGKSPGIRLDSTLLLVAPIPYRRIIWHHTSAGVLTHSNGTLT